MLSNLLVSLVSIACVAAQTSPPRAAKRAFVRAGIVPDVLSSFHPIMELDVTYSFNDTSVEVTLGMPMPRDDTANRPAWTVPHVKHDFKDDTFVVAMVDPDAPTPQDPTEAQIRHFLGGGFTLQGNELVNNTPALSDYRQPTPPNTSDPHRYVFLLFAQPADFPTSIDTPIQNFNISAFAEEFDMGPPLAGNFITVSTMNTTTS